MLQMLSKRVRKAFDNFVIGIALIGIGLVVALMIVSNH